MKKIYSFVLMAAMLLVSANSWAVIRTAATADEFEAAWKAVQNNDIIQLTGDFSINKTFWLGTLTMNGTAKSITLDLNGHKITNDGNHAKLFFISHGELKVITSVPGGEIIHNGASDSSTYEIFRVGGSTYKTVDPKTAESGFYSHLVIGEGVKLTAKANAVVIDQTTWPLDATSVRADGVAGNLSSTFPSALKTCVYGHGKTDKGVDKNNNYGLANGARIDIYGTIRAHKYAIKANGNLGAPGMRYCSHPDAGYSFWENPEQTIAYTKLETDTKYTPFIYIHSTADLRTLDVDQTYSIAAYSGGYARWMVEGTCIGSTGVYVKSGELVLNNATVASNYTGTYQPAGETERGSGVDAGGSGIVMETATAYAGDMSVTVQGDTKVTATVGYAIDEAVSPQSDSTKVDALTITGGTFEAGDKGTMHITEVTVEAHQDPNQETIITILGGETISEKADSIGNMSLAQFLADEQSSTTHITYVENEQGKTVMVISQGAAPVVNNKVSDAAPDASIKWQGTIVNDTIKTDLTLAELEINDTLPSGAPREQILVINSGVKFEAGRVILGKGARIIVEAGGKFIVSGTQGIVAPVIENITLRHNSNTGKYATFLFNPAVASNKHPNATVEFTTNSWWVGNNPGEYQWEWFGIPTYENAKSITSTAQSGTIYATVEVFENNQWIDLGYIGGTYDNNPAVLAKLNKPFAAYNLMAYRALNVTAPEITISGELVGNVNASLYANMKWNTFANSYTAEVDAAELLKYFNQHSQNIDASIYLADHAGNGSLTWNTRDIENVGSLKLRPMQAFLLLNNLYVEETAIDYASMVYAPATNNAPARRAIANSTTSKVVVNVANENGTWDDVELRENVNTKVCEKFLNSDINIYVVDGEKNDIVAVEDLDGTYVGFSTVNGGNFTISFANVAGREFDLIDMETGAKVAAMEGATYEFSAAANTTNDYRFKVVERKVATAMENTEAVKSAKGIYTITGQYVGEMNVWNSLPAGVYVINGEKCVK